VVCTWLFASGPLAVQPGGRGFYHAKATGCHCEPSAAAFTRRGRARNLQLSRARQNSSSALATRTFSARAEAEDSRLKKDLLEVLATYRQNPSRNFVPESNPVAGIIYFRLTEIDAGHLTRDTNSYHVRLPRMLSTIYFYTILTPAMQAKRYQRCQCGARSLA